jgi:DNA-binding NtrC family response regulator
MDAHRRSLIIVLVDAEGQRSPIYAAARRAGHRPVVVTGVDTAVAILGSLVADAVIVRSTSPERDRATVARLSANAPEVPVRLLTADGPLADALDDAQPVLN